MNFQEYKKLNFHCPNCVLISYKYITNKMNNNIYPCDICRLYHRAYKPRKNGAMWDEMGGIEDLLLDEKFNDLYAIVAYEGIKKKCQITLDIFQVNPGKLRGSFNFIDCGCNESDKITILLTYTENDELIERFYEFASEDFTKEMENSKVNFELYKKDEPVEFIIYECGRLYLPGN